MTLSPVFRSLEAVEALHAKGHIDRLAGSIKAQRANVQRLHTLLPDVLDGRYIAQAREESDDIVFLQEHFFLILFDSLYRSLGCSDERLNLYGLLNLCIRGIVVAGDNLFDDETKMDLPLSLGYGSRFASIMQLLCFDHLIARILDKHLPDSRDDGATFRRNLLNALAYIGTLEGSEEGGVETVLPVEEMVEKVHGVRGGKLFALAFIAPDVWETGREQQWQTARRGIARLGTAFQIVDDLTDFEFDMTRRSHNLLMAQIVHGGTEREKAALEKLRQSKEMPSGLVETTFTESARAVFDRARREAEAGFKDLQDVGFWFPPADAHLFVSAIAGDAGDTRVKSLSDSTSSPAVS